MKKALRSGEELASVESRIEEMDRKLDRLRSLYESFFMGTERTPPNVPRRELNRLMLEMQQVPIGNATIRFRFQSLLQRWVILTAYWNRTMREIESGTYRRDLAKAHRMLAKRGGVLTEEEARQLGIPSSRVKAFVERQQRRPTSMRGEAPPLSDEFAAQGNGTIASGAPTAMEAGAHGTANEVQPPAAIAAVPLPRAPRSVSGVVGASDGPSAAGARVPGLGAGELETFYARYAAVHEQATGGPPRASLEQMRSKLQQEIPKLIGDTGGRVELDVAVEGGKVRLKVRPVR